MEQIDTLFDPVFQELQHNNEVNLTNQMVDSIQRLGNGNNSYSTLLSTLWHTGMPCTDTEVSNNKEDKSVLRYCEWKGKQVPCASIFSTFPTDQGMCCTFNMKAADELFSGESYSHLIQQLQNKERPLGFHALVERQMTEPGKKKGLFVVLDSRSDILSTSSVDEDKQGFIGMITQSGNFPQVNVGGFDIKPGHANVVSLTATMISADNALQNMDPKSRNCFFQWESSSLKFFKIYTHSNCIFECNFFFALKILQAEQQFKPCWPWYFPSLDKSPKICDPWEASQLIEKMSNVPIHQCNHCLSNCDSTILKSRISTSPHRKCQLNSFRSNTFCNKNDGNRFSSEVITDLTSYDLKRRFNNKTYFYKKYIASEQRKFGSSLKYGDVFEITNKPYNAFDNDIASVQIYFEAGYATRIQKSPRLTWTNYFSNVGGIFGLVLGIGIISFVELFWIVLRYLLILRSFFKT